MAGEGRVGVQTVIEESGEEVGIWRLQGEDRVEVVDGRSSERLGFFEEREVIRFDGGGGYSFEG